jgi:ferredoxin-NADP reductase
LKVVQIATETPTVKTFRLIEPTGVVLPFDYLPGQFMQVELSAQDHKLRRAYTIASSPTRRAYAELTIRRAGEVSQHLHDQIKVGDSIKVSAPYGDFTFTGMDDESIVLIGGGVGITPLMSTIRYLTDLAWPGQIFFVYSARSTDEFVFRHELEYLQRRHPNLHVLAAMARSEGTTWMGPEGLITRDLLQAGIPEIAKQRIHLCGPPPMMAAMKEVLAELGVPKQRIHSEAFGPASMPADILPAAAPSTSLAARVAATKPASTRPIQQPPTVAENTVVFSRSGKSARLAAGTTVLDAAESVGVDIPWSCRSGICGTCKVKLLEGKVAMAVEDALSAEEKARGIILACQAKSLGGNLIVDA